MLVLALALALQQTTTPPASPPRVVQIAPGAPGAAAAPGTLPEPTRVGERLICRSEPVLGSNRRERVCMTAEQRDQRRQNSLDYRNGMDQPANPEAATRAGGG